MNVHREPSDRVQALDMLRGIALLGVLLVNLLTEFRVPLSQWLAQFHTQPGALNHAVDWVVGVGIEGKAYATFALLFGAGLAAQSDADRSNGFFSRRLSALLGIGILHLLLLFSGDILSLYALLGFGLILLRRLSLVWLISLSVLGLLANASLLAPCVVIRGLFAGAAKLSDRDALIREALDVYANGSFGQILEFRLMEIREVNLPLLAGSALRTFSMALLGMALWRLGWLSRPASFKKAFRVAAVPLLLTGATCTAIEAYAAANGKDLGRAAALVATLAVVPLALAYSSGVLLVATTPRGARLLRPMADVGRMSLSHYLAQSVVFGLVFYGYGLGQFGKWGSAPALLLGITFFVVQVVVSRAWLRRHDHGPAEAAWRWIAYRGWRSKRE